MKITILLGAALLCALPLFVSPTPSRAQQLTAASASGLAGIDLPGKAIRVVGNDVPREVNDALDEMIKSGGAGIKRGKTEVFAWTDGLSKKQVTQLKAQIAANLKRGGWEYEEGETLEGAQGTSMISALKTAPTRKALIGFWVPDPNTFVLAWTEMLPAGDSSRNDEENNEEPVVDSEHSAPNGNTGIGSPKLPVSTGGDLLVGLTMPRGAAPWNAIAAQFTGVLTDLAKQKVVKLPPTGQIAQVWAWKGDAYREDRVAFTKTAVSGALTGAGYVVSEVDANELQGVNVFEHFPTDADNALFVPTLMARPSYFKATNAAKNQTLLGTYIQSDDALVLGLMPVQFKAAPVAKPLPDVGEGVVLVTNFKNVSAGLPALKNPTFAPLQPKPRTVRGWAKDMGGKALDGVEVAVQCSAGGGFRTTHKARTNAQGLYEVLLPAGVAEVVQADYQMTWNGQTFDRRLGAATGNFTQFNSAEGHVENLVLKAAGEYGGNIRVLQGLPEGGTIEITLQPQGTTADGAPARTLVFRYASGMRTGETFLQFIPLAKYTLSAKLIDSDETLPVRVRHTFGDDQELKTSLPVTWESGYDYLSGDTGKSNLRAFQVVLEP